MNQAQDNRAGRLPPGSYPAVLTAFREDGAIDWEGVDRITDFCLENGSAGLFAGGLSAEIDCMNDQEQVAVAERIVRRAGGRVPVLGGAIGAGPIDAQAELVRRVAGTGADVVTVSVCQFAAEAEDDRVWLERVETFLEQVPATVRLALYECPLPYWRLLSDETITWVAGSGRFHFLKDTCCRIETIRTRLEIVRGTQLQQFNANSPTLLASLEAGVDGFCGIGANYFPELYDWLCRHHRDEPELAGALGQFLAASCSLTEGPFYPVSAKEYLRQRGLAIGRFSRRLPPTLPAEVTASLEQMRAEASNWANRLVG